MRSLGSDRAAEGDGGYRPTSGSDFDDIVQAGSTPMPERDVMQGYLPNGKLESPSTGSPLLMVKISILEDVNGLDC